MNFKISFLMVLMLFTLGWSLNIVDYLNHDESYEDIVSIDMIGPQGAYIMYYLNEEPLFMVYNGDIVKDESTLKTVLERYYFEKDFFRTNDLDEIQATILAFNESRSYLYNDGRVKAPSAPEKYCRQITGTLFRECYDKQSCLLSCSAVPVCKYAIEGLREREDFLEGIHDLQEDSNKLEENAKRIMEISEKFRNLKYNSYNDNVRLEIVELFDRMGEIKELTANIRSNFLFSDLLPASGLQSYCAPVNYSIQSENNLNILSSTYSSKLRNLFEIDDYVDEVLNETNYRVDLKINLATENEYTKKYDVIDKEYKEIYSKYVRVSKYIDDVNLRNDMNLLKKHLDNARDNIYSGEYNKADLNIRQFDVLSKKYKDVIDLYHTEVDEIEILQTQVNKKFILAEWDLKGIFFQLGPQLNELKIKKSEVDKKLGAKVNPDELEGITYEYEEIYNEINDIIKVKREQMLDTTLTTMVIKSNDFSNSFSSILGAMGMDYETRKSSREYVFPLTLIIGSLFIVGGFMGSFVYLVGSGKIRLHKIAAMLWSFIFISFFITVSGGAIATYLLINEKSVSATFDTFYYGTMVDDTIVIVLDERNGAIENNNCANELTRILKEQMNKTVIYYEVNHNECYLLPDLGGQINPEQLTITECDERMDPFTKIRIVKGEESLTSFTLKYSPEAIIEGDNNYINSCELAVILDEEI